MINHKKKEDEISTFLFHFFFLSDYMFRPGPAVQTLEIRTECCQIQPELFYLFNFSYRELCVLDSRARQVQKHLQVLKGSVSYKAQNDIHNVKCPRTDTTLKAISSIAKLPKYEK